MATPPSPATMPTRTCGSPIVAVSAMKMTSQRSAIEAPSPMAWPFSAATIGHLDVEQIPDELLGVAAQRFHPTGLAQRGEPGEVAAGAERAAAAGEEHAARVGLAPEPREERGEIVVQGLVDGVQRARRVGDRDAQHVAARARARRVVKSSVRQSIVVSVSSPSSTRPASS